MTTFRPRILQCPHCNNKMSTYELTSYMVHSSVTYSDGKVVSNSPKMSDKNILICSKCNNEFWRNDAFLEDDYHNTAYDELPEAMDFHDLPFAFDSDYSFKLATHLSELLERGFANTVEREVFLRFEIWHLLNNNNRSDSHGLFKKNSDRIVVNDSDKAGDLFKNNLSRLISIYKPENDDQRLMLAEMHRELGNFSQALSVLDEIENVNNNIAYKKIKSATKKKNSKVINLN